MERYIGKTLIDVDKGVYVEDWRISPDDIRLGPYEWSIEKKRLRGGVQEGVDVIEVGNGRLSFTVVPTRGLGIWKGQFDGCPLDWGSPVKVPVNPRHIKLEDRGGLGFLEGMNEWVFRCGLESNGAPGEDTIVDNMGNERRANLTLHGKIANTPADHVEVRVGLDPPHRLSVIGTVCERSMFGANLSMYSNIATALGSNWLSVEDIVENSRSTPWEMQLLYHCNYGTPFLERGSRLVAPVRSVAPRDARAAEGVENWSVFGAPEPGFVEQVYFCAPLWDKEGRTKVMLVNRGGDKAVTLSFSRDELPYFTLWKNTADIKDGYVAGLEPATNYPNGKRFERSRGRVVKLGPGERYRAEILLETYIGRTEISRIEEDILGLQKQVQPKILPSPDPQLSE
jgi:hypothetical protein